MNMHTPITLSATWLDLAMVLNTSQFRADCAVADAIAETRRLGREAMEKAREKIERQRAIPPVESAVLTAPMSKCQTRI